MRTFMLYAGYFVAKVVKTLRRDMNDKPRVGIFRVTLPLGLGTSIGQTLLLD